MQADKPIPLTWLWVIEIVTFGIIEYKRYQNFKKVGEVSRPSGTLDQTLPHHLLLLSYNAFATATLTHSARRSAACSALMESTLLCSAANFVVIDHGLQFL